MNAVLRIALFGLAVALAGCGFHLRGEIPGTPEQKTVYVLGLSRNNPFYGDFAQVLAYSGGRLAQKPAEAGAIINVSLARHERRPITLSSQGRANMFELTFRLVYQIQNAGGKVLAPQQELEVRRDYFNNQVSPLGQADEENLMRQEMEKEAAQTLLRRVVYTLKNKPSPSA